MADQQHHSNPKKPQHTTRNWIIGIIVVLIVALGGYGYHLYASAHCRAARYSGHHSSHYFGLKRLCFAEIM